MQIKFVPPSLTGTGAIALGVPEGGKLSGQASEADRLSGGAIKRAMAVSRFSGKPGQILEVVAPAGLKASRLLLAGLGKPEKFDALAAERVAAGVVGKLFANGETALTFAIDAPEGAPAEGVMLASHLAMGARLRCYTFNRYRTKDRDEHEPTLKEIAVATSDPQAAKRTFAAMDAVAEGVFLARDLVNEPPNVLSPEEFAKRVQSLSKLGVEVRVLGEAEMKKLGMGALLGVGQGSERESKLVVMQWNGAKKAEAAPVALVGKGVCFDSGGLSLKSGAGMMGMKGDMGGAAAVAGTIQALAARKARANVVGVVGLVENMPDGKAQRPDDVVKSMSGQTIEVLNTDAEGRLVLADALWYAQSQLKPKCVIDLATLTGAILVALGHEHAGLFSNDDALAEQITNAARAVGEPAWRLPLGDGYDKLLKSKIADMKNIGGPNAGSITAAQFLQRFVNKTPWAHLDIAGVAWQDGEHKELAPSWGTGWGVRVLDRLIADNYEK
ncbi:MAG TPA: leucyl aminopeptidase [Rhizomicrobium sp.]|jgi:leucyl aminopeptidase|nr:leucyl aminopeptidase [Rhizomicrobium sp.]